METLLENPIILIVLIGIISSLFKRMKGTKQEIPKTRPHAKPAPVFQRTGEERPPINSSIEIQNVKKDEKKLTARAEYIERQKLAKKSMRGHQEQQRTAELRGHSKQETSRSLKKEPAGKADRKNRTSISTGKQSLVQGMMWSEILGPPRARNPHRSLKGK